MITCSSYQLGKSVQLAGKRGELCIDPKRLDTHWRDSFLGYTAEDDERYSQQWTRLRRQCFWDYEGKEEAELFGLIWLWVRLWRLLQYLWVFTSCYCIRPAIPDKDTRLERLKVVDKKMQLSKEVDNLRETQNVFRRELQAAKARIGQVDDGRSICHEKSLAGLSQATLIDTLAQVGADTN